MTQATTALPAVGRRPRAGAKGQASALPRFAKLLTAVLLMPVLGLLVVALLDVQFPARIWAHGGSSSTEALRRLYESLPGLAGLMALGAALGAWLPATTGPERFLQRYGTRLMGGQAGPGQEGSFLVRWAVVQLPATALLALGLAAGLGALGYPTAADVCRCLTPWCYGLFLAQLTRRLAWNEEICREDGTLFAWISTAVAQVTWLAMGLVFFLQARPLWQFAQEWFHAAAARAVYLARLFDR